MSRSLGFRRCSGALPVRIIAGGRAIAAGQIVSVGDSYGVLIETVLKEG